MVLHLREIRDACGLTLKQVSADLAETDTPLYFTSLHRREIGRIPVTLQEVENLARRYQRHPWELVTFVDVPAPQHCPCQPQEGGP